MSATSPLALSFRGVDKIFRRRHIPGGHTTMKSQLVSAILGRTRAVRWASLSLSQSAIWASSTLASMS